MIIVVFIIACVLLGVSAIPFWTGLAIVVGTALVIFVLGFFRRG
jgi:hypothetical protein